MIKCEQCGEEITSVLAGFFLRDGSDADFEVPIVAYSEAVIMELNQNWTGYELSEEERLDTIVCPCCKKFPFKQREMNSCDIVRVVCFRSASEEDEDEG